MDKSNLSVKHIYTGNGLGQGFLSVEPIKFGIGPTRPLAAPDDFLLGKQLAPVASVTPVVAGANLESQASKSPMVERLKVRWHGLLTGFSGYAKANREILGRIASDIDTAFTPSLSAEASDNSRDTRDDDCPIHVTFLLPKKETRPGYRVIYTMMETEVVHQDMISLMNENYHECWTPTNWNAATFKKSGLAIPIHVMPLGVDIDVYRPEGEKQMPAALRLTGPRAGKEEIPSGFLFIYVCQPTFRKGIEVLLEAFDRAFESDPQAGLVMATTAYSGSAFTPERRIRSRIWLLSGMFSESDLAAIYRSSKAYVCTSRGEGYNLPVVEAAAAGLPVIVPRVSAHPELVPKDCGFFFDADSSRVFRDAHKISPWYDGIRFSDFRESSLRQLVGILKGIKANYARASFVGRKYMELVRSKYTWAAAAERVVKRLKEIEETI